MPIDLDILLSDAWPVTLSKEAEKIAAVEYRKYLKTKSIEVDSANPLTIYYVIRDLSSEEQVKFIKDNIEYIRKHDSDIFLYNMLEPSSLSKHLSYDAINEIYNLDKGIFRKIINGGSMQFLYSFSEEEVIKFFDVFHDEIVNYSDRSMVNMLSYVRNHHFQLARNKNLYETIILAKEYDKKFIDFVMKRYKDFYYKEENLLSFIALALDMGLGEENFNEFILVNKDNESSSILALTKPCFNNFSNKSLCVPFFS